MKTRNDMHATVSRIADDNGFHLLKDKWNGLLNESPANNFFLRWEWLWCWWDTYKQDDYELCILLSFIGGELTGIMPCYIKNIRWKNFYDIKRLMFLGTAESALYSEYMDIICARGKEETVTNAMME
ncbi:MAG: hypothetical protein Q8P48_05600, partial [Deltaproteobacteria bacterium]|nr:hypothetical protein [Deltaproteobacteria bacterium]